MSDDRDGSTRVLTETQAAFFLGSLAGFFLGSLAGMVLLFMLEALFR